MKKTTKKPLFVADLTNAETMNDVYYQFAVAKVDAGVPISKEECIAVRTEGFNTAVKYLSDIVSENKFEEICTVEGEDAEKILKEIDKILHKKQPWYKRLWKWATKPFRKNK